MSVKNPHNEIECQHAEFKEPECEGPILCNAPDSPVPICAHAKYCGAVGHRILKPDALTCTCRKDDK